jgi:hypothetical protein
MLTYAYVCSRMLTYMTCAPRTARASNSKAMINALMKHFAQVLDGTYAARVGGYLSDALSLPHNLNRTLQVC